MKVSVYNLHMVIIYDINNKYILIVNFELKH